MITTKYLNHRADHLFSGLGIVSRINKKTQIINIKSGIYAEKCI